MSTLNVAIVGHVDHGKSTILGKLLVETNSLPKGKLKQVKDECKRNSKRFEYAFLLDALKDEQSQGITIDFARCFFKYNDRRFMFLDAPGHVEFIKNMITGSSNADVAILVIDANEGIKENTKRHGYLLSFLNVKDVIILVNKMDLSAYDEAVFNIIKNEYSKFLDSIHIYPIAFVPVSGHEGDNLSIFSQNMNWYKGPTFLDILMNFEKKLPKENLPLRFPVQDIYKFTDKNDQRRIIAGTVLSGMIKKNDKLIFYPSKSKASVKTIESFNSSQESVSADESTGITLDKPIFLKRGEIAVKENHVPLKIARKIKAKVFWLAKFPFQKGKKYKLKHCTSSVNFSISDIISVVDTSTYKQKDSELIEQNDVAEVIIGLDNEIAFDISDNIIETSRFVISHNYIQCGGGLIEEAFDEAITDQQNKISVFKSNDTIHEKNQKCIVFQDAEKIDNNKLEQDLLDQGFRVFSIYQNENITSSLQIEKILESVQWLLKSGVNVLLFFRSPIKEHLNLFFEYICNNKLVFIGFDKNNDIGCSITLNENSTEYIQNYLIKNAIIKHQ